LTKPISSKYLEEILTEEYEYNINKTELSSYVALENLRSVFVSKTKTLLLAGGIDEAQRTFIYAKEIAYNFLEITDRLYTFPWIKFKSFDQVLHNFYASYFAVALTIPKDALTSQLETLFNKKTFDSVSFLKTLEAFNASPESFYQRLTNILPKAFNIQNLFFLRFTHKVDSEKFHLKKELHLSHQHSPRANETNEHYCRRWVSLKVLKDISKSKNSHEFDIQISNYEGDNAKYLVFSSATKDPFRDNRYRSISVGLLINKQLERKLKFLEDTTIKHEIVGVTCERCAIKDCLVRQAPAIVLEKEVKNDKIETIVKDLHNKFSS
jgi:predicted transcriptional regulator